MYQVIQTFSSYNWTILPTLVIFAPAIFSLTGRPGMQTQHPSVSCPPAATVVTWAEALLRLTAYPLPWTLISTPGAVGKACVTDLLARTEANNMFVHLTLELHGFELRWSAYRALPICGFPSVIQATTALRSIFAWATEHRKYCFGSAVGWIHECEEAGIVK